MFCRECGREIPDAAKFCSGCGVLIEPLSNNMALEASISAESPTQKSSTQQTVSNQNSQQSQFVQSQQTVNSTSAMPGQPDYRQLGGWLAVIAYGQLIGMVLMTISTIIAFIKILPYMKYLGFLGIVCQLLVVGGYLLSAYFCINMYTMIKNADCMFLRFYEKIMLITVGLYVLDLFYGLITYHRIQSSDIRALLTAVLVFGIWMTYFRKSVRVRTYFGSDRYLRESMFSKNVQAPPPVAY